MAFLGGALIVLGPWLMAIGLGIWLGRSGLAVLVVLLGIGIGAVVLMGTGLGWANRFNPETMNSQAIGFVMLPAVLPYFAYCGAVTGGFLGVFLYRQAGFGRDLAWLLVLSRLLAIVMTAYLAGIIPALLLVSGGEGAGGEPAPSIADLKLWGLGLFVLGVTANGVISAWLGTSLSTWAARLLIQWRGY